MSEEEKKRLEQQLWKIANELRGKMDADEFRDYILGFIFYKYLSEKQYLFANRLLETEGIKDYSLLTDEDDVDAIREESLEKLGYFLRPNELFSAVAVRGNADKEGKSNFILEDLAGILNGIEQSTMGTDSEDDFNKLFEDLDLSSTKLGRTVDARNTLIAKVLAHLDQIDFELANGNADVLGDAYEYLISQFASGAGKKAGEFYTPQQVSKILAKIVTLDKKKIKSAYDPACGSGSLLLRIGKETNVGSFYGQELNRTTYNLARMNMILHDVHYSKFDIRQEDTLEEPQHLDDRFEAIVANPPFSAKWRGKDNPLFETDDRFSQYGKLVSKSYADFAFVQHIVHQLSDNGTAAVVLPHGALFRSGAESSVRKYLIDTLNCLDAVIGLPLNLFYGTEIPACILILKKCRPHDSDILFVDARDEYEQFGTKNTLSDAHVEKIVSAYANRKTFEKYSYVAPISEVAENHFNLNIPRYIDKYVDEPAIDLQVVSRDLLDIGSRIDAVDIEIEKSCRELRVPSPTGENIRLLKDFKVGCMQRLFKQSDRFLKVDGSSYPEWKPTTLGAIADRSTEKNSNLSYTRVLTNSAARGVIDQGDYFEKDIANVDNIDGYYVVKLGDFVYNPRISVSAPVGPINRNDLAAGIMSPLYTVFRFKSADTDFYKHYFRSSMWHRYMNRIANFGARHDRMAISIDDFLDMPLPTLDPAEQKDISDFLNLIDQKIELLSGGAWENETEVV
ncbi:MAG: type I restriction-modification system subunit M [Hyphomonas oceanitis]|uniref:type I restriction-modification system subunit M n=1 Tax=Hyphomonas oceanitis TaxID=81033 RepID=UPI003002870C